MEEEEKSMNQDKRLVLEEMVKKRSRSFKGTGRYWLLRKFQYREKLIHTVKKWKGGRVLAKWPDLQAIIYGAWFFKLFFWKKKESPQLSRRSASALAATSKWKRAFILHQKYWADFISSCPTVSTSTVKKVNGEVSSSRCHPSLSPDFGFSCPLSFFSIAHWGALRLYRPFSSSATS